MSEIKSTTKAQFVNQLKDKADVSSPFLVKTSQLATDRNGKPYLMMTLMDRTGEMDCRVWSQVPEFATMAVPDAFVHVKGRCQSYQGRIQMVVNSLHVLREDEVNTEEYLSASSVNVESLLKDVSELVDSMEDPHYKALVQSVMIEDSEIRECLHTAPAAKSVHHAYKSGLLEHMVSVCQLLDQVGKHYAPKVDRDLLLLGGFFHDIAKIWEMKYERVTDYTDEGRLIGHLVMGVELIERKINELEANDASLKFPEDKRLLAKHMVLSHHGRLEYGSPKRPKCVEALIVHMIDDLDSKVNQIMTFVEGDLNPGKWTGLHRSFERFFFKPEWARVNQPS